MSAGRRPCTPSPPLPHTSTSHSHPRRRRREKWSATKWIHVAAYGGTAAEQKAKWGDCVDANEMCPGWAKRGECGSNAAYMLLYCRLSCGECTPKKRQGPVIEVGGPNHGKAVGGAAAAAAAAA